MPTSTSFIDRSGFHSWVPSASPATRPPSGCANSSAWGGERSVRVCSLLLSPPQRPNCGLAGDPGEAGIWLRSGCGASLRGGTVLAGVPGLPGLRPGASVSGPSDWLGGACPATFPGKPKDKKTSAQAMTNAAEPWVFMDRIVLFCRRTGAASLVFAPVVFARRVLCQRGFDHELSCRLAVVQTDLYVQFDRRFPGLQTHLDHSRLVRQPLLQHSRSGGDLPIHTHPCARGDGAAGEDSQAEDCPRAGQPPQAQQLHRKLFTLFLFQYVVHQACAHGLHNPAVLCACQHLNLFFGG